MRISVHLRIRRSDLVDNMLLPEKFCIMLALMEAAKAG
jgi:hypothetical protein